MERLPLVYQDFIDKSLSITTNEEFLQLCCDIRDSVGFSSVICLSNFSEHDHRKMQLTVGAHHKLFSFIRHKLVKFEHKTLHFDEDMTANTLNLSMEIQHSKVDNFYDWDPTLVYSRSATTPSLLNALQSAPNLLKKHPLFAEGVLEFEIERFLTIPVHGPKSEYCAFRFNHTKQNKLNEADLNHAIPIINLLSHHLYEALNRIHASQQHQQQAPPLSPKQIKILRLASQGKSTSEIADELYISDNTVLYHLKKIFIGLEVNNRQHAVAKALNLGLIDIC